MHSQVEQKNRRRNNLTSLLLSFAPLLLSIIFVTPPSLIYFGPSAQAQTKIDRYSEASNLNYEGQQLLVKGRYRESLEKFEQALTIIREVGEGQLEGIILTNTGQAYYGLGQYSKALQYFQQALTTLRKIHVSELAGEGLSPDTQQALAVLKEAGVRTAEGTTLDNIGIVYQNLGRYSEALEYHQQALEIHRKFGNRTKQGTVLNNIGATYQSLGRYSEALEYFQQALEIHRKFGNRRLEGKTLGNIGRVYDNLGRYPRALEYYQQALAISKEVGNRSSEGTNLNSIGGIYYTLGQYPKALEYYQHALVIRREIGDQYGEGITLNNIGSVYKRTNQDSKALEYYQQSLAIDREIGNRSGEATDLNNIAEIYYGLGQYSKTLEFLQQALTISQKIGDRNLEGVELHNIGRTYQKMGQYSRGLEYYQRSLKIFREIGDRSSEGAVLGKIGLLLEVQKQPELAIIFLKQSISNYEKIRGDLKVLPRDQQQSYTQTVAQYYRRLADLLLQQNRVLEAQRVLDLLKVQELDDYLRDVRGNSQTAQGVEYWQPEQRILELYNQAIAQGNELAQLRAIPDPKLTPKQRQRLEQLVAAEAKILESFDAFINRPEVTAAVQQLSQTTKNQNVELTQLNSLQNDLRQTKQNAVLLYPLILEDRLELVLVTPNSPPIRRPVEVRREDLNRAIATFLQALKDPTSDATKPAQQLYAWLIQPIEADLKAANAQTIVYAPDGQLRYLPLAALHDGNQWLTQRFRVNYITAASLTDFDDPPQPQMRVLAAAFADTSRQFTVRAGDRSLSFAGLPYAKTEVENLAAMIPGTTELFNDAFNRKSTLPRLGSYTLVHLATHAAFLPGQPEESFILFGDGDRLSLRDLKQLNLPNVDLVVLSACETGVGNQLGNGIEILGFGFQMQRTGARAAIASLWQVSDGGTQVLMNAFYTALQHKNITKAEALRQAQIALITQKHPSSGKTQNALLPGMSDRLTHPYYWAPFILIGNGL